MSTQKVPEPFRVYIGIVSTGYLNREVLAQTIRNGLLYCNVLNPQNTTPILLKVDPPHASQSHNHTFTHPDFMNVVIEEILKINERASIELTCEQGIFPSPTLKRFKQAHYHLLPRFFPKKVKLLPIDACKQSLYYLSKGSDRASNEMIAPDFYSKNLFPVYCPKLKNDLFVDGLGGALRLGYQSEADDIDRRICDMLEICNPKLIITDGIMVPAGGSHATQRGYELGAILIANNAVAHDWVASEILYLDPSNIKHLALAIKRGWGPQNIDQIQLGGVGAAGLRLLAQKSRQWIFSLPDEDDNTKFPVEILTTQGSDKATQSLVLDWLLAFHDVPQTKQSMARWPESSFCVGTVVDYPTQPMIYAIGNKAIRSMDHLISHTRTWFQIFGIKFQTVQLKNGSWHQLLQIHNEKNLPTPGFKRLCLAFYLGSLGKMKHPFFSFWNYLRPTGKPKPVYRKISTQDLPHNSWWAIASKLTNAATASKPDNN